MNKVAISLGVLILVVLAVIAARTWSLPDEMAELGTRVDQQTSIMHRALGTFVPLVLPDEVVSEFKEIERQLAAASENLPAQSQLDELNKRLASLMTALPPWAQEEMLPALVPLRWNLEALWLLSGKDVIKANDTIALRDFIDSTDSHLGTQPPTASEDLRQRLSVSLTEAQVELDSAERLGAINDARLAIGRRESADILRAMEVLSEYDDDAVQKLIVQLQHLHRVISIDAALDAIGRDLALFDANKDSLTRLFLLDRATQGLMGLQVELLTADIKDAETTGRVNGLRKETTQRRDSIQRDYQVWALGQISKVRTLDAIEELLIGQIASAADRINPLSDAHKAATSKAQETLREDMIRYLGPIDRRALDLAVDTWFGKVFSSRFESLGNEDQQKVVNGFAIAVKKPLG